MRKNNSKVIANQRLFFNLNAKKKLKGFFINKLFTQYVNEEAVKCFNWIKNSKSILDYGCGIGDSINFFLQNLPKKKYTIYGVDIAENVIVEAKKKYPQFNFYKILNNKIPQINDNSLDAVIMFHILHHSRNHLNIFKEVYSKLKKNGKYLIIDLSSNNFLVNLGRFFFLYLPTFIKDKFNDDLVVDGNIPEKYKVDVNLVISQLKKSGFIIKELGYGHLFFFIFAWIDKFVPLSKNKMILYLYKKFINFEKYLLQYDFFNKQAEVFSIKCLKQ